MQSLVLVALLALTGCNVKRTFECSTDTECQGVGTNARCEANNACSFDDLDCASGRRYDEYAGGGFGDRCVGAMDGPDGGVPPNCPTNYVVVGSLSGAYRFSTAGAMWPNAEADCEDDGAGTHLAIIDGAAENTALQGLVGISRVWLGISDRITEGTYLKVTSGVQAYLPWEPGEPMGEDDCVAVKDAQFADDDCTDVRPYVCECDGVEPVPAAF